MAGKLPTGKRRGSGRSGNRAVSRSRSAAGSGSCGPRAAASIAAGRTARSCAISATAAGGTRRGRPGAMAGAGRSPRLPRPSGSRCGRPGWCWRRRTSTTILPTAAGGTATSGRCASGATCCTTGPSIAAASGSPCAGAGLWATCSRAPTRPDNNMAAWSRIAPLSKAACLDKLAGAGLDPWIRHHRQ